MKLSRVLQLFTFKSNVKSYILKVNFFKLFQTTPPLIDMSGFRISLCQIMATLAKLYW